MRKATLTLEQKREKERTRRALWRAKNPEKTRAATRESMARWRTKHPRAWRESNARWAAAHPEKVRETARAVHLRRKYGLSVAEYDLLMEVQNGRCAICGRTPSRLVVGHSHSTGRVRGLLRNQCNRGIGYLGDDATRLRAAVQYLERHGISH